MLISLGFVKAIRMSGHISSWKGDFASTTPYRANSAGPIVLSVLPLTENVLQTKITPFTHCLWRRVPGTGHPGSLTNFVAHFTKKLDSRTFNFSHAPRMNSRL